MNQNECEWVHSAPHFLQWHVQNNYCLVWVPDSTQVETGWKSSGLCSRRIWNGLCCWRPPNPSAAGQVESKQMTISQFWDGSCWRDCLKENTAQSGNEPNLTRADSHSTANVMKATSGRTAKELLPYSECRGKSNWLVVCKSVMSGSDCLYSGT